MMSRTSYALRNAQFSILNQVITYIGNFVIRKVFLIVLSTEYLGLNGVFSNILSLLSLAELGFGTAISYSLYKPLAENNEKELKSLMSFAKRFYTIMGISVFALGVLITPFLSYIIGDITQVSNVVLIYLMFVLDSSLSYFFIYKRDLIITDQKQYITDINYSILNLVKSIGQIIILLATKNYILYLSCQLFFTLLGNIIVSKYVTKLYPWIMNKETIPLDKDIKSTIVINIKSVFLHRIGNAIVFSTDNLLIAHIFGVISVGLYSNYYLIITALKTTYSRLYGAALASIGNLAATSDKQYTKMMFDRINFFGGWLFGWSTICLVILFNPFIEIWLGKEYLFNFPIVIMLSINFYVTGMRESVRTFRSALGVYRYDRYKSIFEASINLVASIILAKKIGIIGIFIGTFLSTMLVCFWVEPYMLYKHGLHGNTREYFGYYAYNTIITLLAYIPTVLLSNIIKGNSIGEFLYKIVICVTIPNAIFIILNHKRNEFIYYYNILKKWIKYKR